MTTIYDIARAAGVTAATVSHVLSGKKPVSEATRQKVMKYIDELGYRPNLLARGLITRSTRTIGLIVPIISNPFYAEVIDAAERIAHRAGFRIMATNTQDDTLLGQEILEDLHARRVDGIIVMGGSGGLSIPAINTLISHGFPMLSCIWDEETERIAPNVSFDYLAGGRLVAEHLLALGHRRIGIIAHGVAEKGPQHHLRVSGCLEALAEAGYPFDATLLTYGDSSLQSGKDAALQLLARLDPPTAIFATNDLMAIGALSAAWERGLHIPRDLSVVGFDNIELTTYTTPPITTVIIDRVALMEKSVEMLLALIEGKHVDVPPTLKPVLAVRGSTAHSSRKEGSALLE
jgi:DNA-binding LacI/PurR family transcriptional regulator